jgi:HJR/Mrr/RecB family endonuclease
MIIRGTKIHEPTWDRLLELCEGLSNILETAENNLKLDTPENESDEEEWQYALSDLDDARYWLDIVVGKVESRESVDLREAFEDFWEATDEYFDDDEYFSAEIADILDTLEIEQGTLLYTPTSPLIEIPKLIVSASDDLLKTLVRNPDLLYSLHPRRFEEVIAEIFFRNGFEVELTKATRDGGKDVIAIYNKLNINTKYIIECKRYAKERKVSLALVQRLLGVKIASAANKAILATTSSFTRDAIVFTSNHMWDLELKDYNDIIFWLKSCI